MLRRLEERAGHEAAARGASFQENEEPDVHPVYPLILTSRITKTAQEKLPSSNYTPRSMLLEQVADHHSLYGQYKNRLVEAAKSQREILAAFGIDPQTSL